jgi:hypothetical protein
MIVGVFALGIAEVGLDAYVDLQSRMVNDLGFLIPGKRSAWLFRQGDDGARDRVAYGLGTMASELRPVLGAWRVTVTHKARKMK